MHVNTERMQVKHMPGSELAVHVPIRDRAHVRGMVAYRLQQVRLSPPLLDGPLRRRPTEHNGPVKVIHPIRPIR